MDFTKAFSYLGEDKEWPTKLGLLALATLFSPFILPYLLVLGYGVAISRNVKKGVDQPLPTWDDWSTFLRDGFNVLVVRLIYSAPVWVLMCGFGAVPLLGILRNGGDVSDEVMAGAIFSTLGLVFCLGTLFGLFYALLSPAIMVQYIRHNSIAACLRVGDVFQIVRTQFVNILLMLALGIGMGMALSTVVSFLSIIPILGTLAGIAINLLLTALITAIFAHFYGQLAAVAD